MYLPAFMFCTAWTFPSSSGSLFPAGLVATAFAATGATADTEGDDGFDKVTQRPLPLNQQLHCKGNCASGCFSVVTPVSKSLWLVVSPGLAFFYFGDAVLMLHASGALLPSTCSLCPLGARHLTFAHLFKNVCWLVGAESNRGCVCALVSQKHRS